MAEASREKLQEPLQEIETESGKTTLTSVARVLAILFGACRFICPVVTSAERARPLLANINVWFEMNALLPDDFPEVF